MLRQVQLVRKYCSDKVKAVVETDITRSSYFAHPELLLITMLVSERGEKKLRTAGDRG